MASRVRTGKSRAASVPGPSGADFVRGSWPMSTRAPAPPRIKPTSTRDYGKKDDEPDQPAGNTSFTSRS